ncbi:MAG TPA: Uma2 family endonuclease [Chloroflexota bacterium]
MSTVLKQRPALLIPWAEAVPGYGPVTVDLLLALPDDGYRYEVVEGVLVRVAGIGNEATTIAGVMLAEVYAFVRPRRLGIVTSADGVYKFPGAETGLIPDVGFYRAARRALIADRMKTIPFAPDLAVEVASPDQQPDAMAAKARTYLDGGTSLVWVVWPDRQQVDVWRAGRSVGPVAVLNVGDMLDGEDVVPGFTYLVAEVFADPLS